MLSSDEIRRYQRHLTLPNVGLDGQEKLKAASVLLVGVGGLGSPLALYLAAAGIGRVRIVDYDVVDESNLHRQVLHGASDVGRHKLESAQESIQDINPLVTVEPHAFRLDSGNALDLISQYDIVADGTDNFPTRYLINDACVLTGRPNVYGSIFQFEGQVSVFAHPTGPCYRCLYPAPPPPGLVPSCAEGGVLGVLPGMIGTMQANEVLKLVLGTGEPLVGRLLHVDALSSAYQSLRVRRSKDCPVCGDQPTVTALVDYEAFCGVSPQHDVPEMTVHELHALREEGRGPFVLDVRKPFESAVAAMGADQQIPVEELADRMGELRALPDARIVVHCRSGGRSAKAVRLLRSRGFARAVNLKGGILAWSEEVDPSIPKA